MIAKPELPTPIYKAGDFLICDACEEEFGDVNNFYCVLNRGLCERCLQVKQSEQMHASNVTVRKKTYKKPKKNAK